MGTSAKVGTQTKQKCITKHQSINRSAIHAWPNCGMSGKSVAAAPAWCSAATLMVIARLLVRTLWRGRTPPLFRPQQDVPFTAQRQLDGTVDQVRLTEHGPLVGHRGVIDAQAATLDLAAGLAR